MVFPLVGVWGMNNYLIIFWCFLAGVTTPHISIAGLPDTIEQVKRSIVGIGTYQAIRKQPLVLLGTGFVVADGQHVVTNHHVVSKILDTHNGERHVVFVGHGSRSKVYSVTKVRFDERHDLALLRFDGPALPALKINSRSGVREGDTYAFTGFPIGAVLGLYPVTHTGSISAITPFVTPMNTSRQLSALHIKQLRDSKPYNVYQLDAVAYPGNSGSPLYDTKTGEVVAILNSVLVKRVRENALTNPSGISYAIPAKYIKQLLDRVF
jgi:S1-C subfamily serine protease